MVKNVSREKISQKKMNRDLKDRSIVDSSEMTEKPEISIKKGDNEIIVSVSNYKAEAIRIFSKRSSEEKFSLLAQVSSPVYVDARPNLFGAPELREYMVQFVRNDKQIGIASDVVLIVKK